MFKSLRERLQQWRETADVEAGPEAIGDTGRKIDPKKLDEVLYDLEVGLLENDVAFPVTKTIVDGVAEELQGKRVARDVSFEKAVEAALRTAVEKALARPPPAPGRRPHRHGGADADKPEPHGPDEEDQTCRGAPPRPLRRGRPRGERRGRASATVPRGRRDRRGHPHEDRCGREGGRRPVHRPHDRQADRGRKGTSLKPRHGA